MIRTIYRACRSIYRNYIGYPLSTRQSVRRLLGNGLIEQVHHNNGSVFFTYGTAAGLQARHFPHSDLHVLEQIILKEEYGFAIRWIKDKGLDQQPLRIVDAGANVGYTSIYFLTAFPQASVVAIEPDPSTFSVLEYNLSCSTSVNRPRALHAALLSQSGIPVMIDRQAGDKKDWSFSVKPTNSPDGIPSICIQDLLQQTGWPQIDILKIDIEGSEADLFSAQADLAYLSSVRMVLVEIHDDMADRRLIHQQLAKNGFDIEERSETTFAINKAFN
jgi:FkbM family methyltransferase